MRRARSGCEARRSAADHRVAMLDLWLIPEREMTLAGRQLATLLRRATWRNLPPVDGRRNCLARGVGGKFLARTCAAMKLPQRRPKKSLATARPDFRQFVQR